MYHWNHLEKKRIPYCQLERHKMWYSKVFIRFYAFVNWIIANYIVATEPISNIGFCIYRCINKLKIVLKRRENLFLHIKTSLKAKVLLPPSNVPWTWIKKSTILVHIALTWKTIVVIAALSALTDFTRFLLTMITTMSIVTPHSHFTISNGRTAYVKMFYLYRIFYFMFFCMRNFSSIDW